MKPLVNFIRQLEEDLVGADNRRLFGAWCVAVVFIALLGFYLNTDSVSILGVADSREFQVNFDNPVTIKQVHVLPGQTVKKGDLLLELNQTDLEMQRYVLKLRFDKLSAELKLREQISSLAQESGVLPLGADPLKIEIADTQRELSLVEERLKNLFVFAEVDGRVGAVNFKSGEKAAGFTSILTLLPLTPSFVNGFINENLHAKLKIGDRVEVLSTNAGRIEGRVISLGARIVPIPQRLLRIQNLPAWGREIVVQIPEVNPLLIGEKVSVRRAWTSPFGSFAQADENPLNIYKMSLEPERLEVPAQISRHFQPEISGMVYVPELKQFVLISDDYPEDHPFLLLMNEAGVIQEHSLPISGLQKMEDIESISLQEDSLFLLSSLTNTKKGKVRKERQMFVELRRQGMEFHFSAQVDLREALLKAASESSDELLRELFLDPSEFEVEGHFLREGNLYLALKNPLGPAREIFILKVQNFRSIFSTGRILAKDLSLDRRISLSLSDKDIEVAVTDMLSVGGSIYLSSNYRGKDGSAIWKLDESTGAVSLLQEFKRKHLEALALLPSRCQIIGVFEGREGNFITRLSLPESSKESRCF